MNIIMTEGINMNSMVWPLTGVGATAGKGKTLNKVRKYWVLIIGKVWRFNECSREYQQTSNTVPTQKKIVFFCII